MWYKYWKHVSGLARYTYIHLNPRVLDWNFSLISTLSLSKQALEMLIGGSSYLHLGSPKFVLR
jgi:hypothetical protein